MEIKSPLLSIIIPIYNVEKYLDRCLESIRCQSFDDYEVIMIDDGSHDNSGNICDRYTKIDSRFRVIHQSNAGVAEARSKGLDAAKGLYVMFCDPDDYYIDGSLENCAKYIGKDNAYYSIYCTGFKTLYDDGREVDKTIPAYRVYSRTKGLAMLDSLYMGGFVCNKIYKREIIECFNVRFDKRFKSHEDKLFFIDFISNVNKICLIPVAPYVYCVREGSLSFIFNNIESRVDALKCIHDKVMLRFGGIARFWELGWTRDWLNNYYSKVYGFGTRDSYSDQEREMVANYLTMIDKEYKSHLFYYYFNRIIEKVKKILS